MNRKRIIVILSASLILIIAVLASIPYFVEANRFRSLVISRLESALHRKVSVHSAELTILTGLGLRLNQVVIFEDPRFGAAPFSKVASLRVQLRLLPLLLGKLEVGSIQIDDPEISLVKDKAGIWNFESLGKGTQEGSLVSKPQSSQGGAGAAALVISGLSFHNGTVTVRNLTEASRIQESRYERIDLELTGISLSDPGSFSLQVQLPNSGRHLVRAKGQFGPVLFSDLGKTPLDGKVVFSDASMGSLLAFLSPADIGAVEWLGTVSTETRFKGSLADTIRLEGRSEFKNLQTKRRDQESPEISGDLQYQLDFKPSSGSFGAVSVRLSLPSSVVDLTGNLNNRGQESTLNFHFDSDKCSIEDLMKVASLLGQGPPKGVEARGAAQFHLTVGGVTKAPDITGQAGFNAFQVQYPGLKDRITISPWTLSFDKNGMSSNEFQIAIGERTQLRVHPAAVFSPVKQISLLLDSQNPIPLPDLIAVGSTFGFNLPAGYTIEAGSIGLHVQAQQRLEGNSELTLNGQASVLGTKLHSALFHEPLAVKQAQLKFTGTSISFSSILASLGESNLQGNLQLVKFNSPSVVFNLNVDQLDLVALNKTIASGPKTPDGHSVSLIPSDSWSTPETHWLTPSLLLAAGMPSRPSPPDLLTKLIIHDSRVSIQSVKYETMLLKQASSKLQMKNKILELADLQFRINQGIHTGSAILDFTGPQPSYSFDSRLKDVDVNEFLSQNTSLKNTIYGLLTLDAGLKGNGSSLADITRNLKGQAKLNMLKGRITSFSLSQQVAALGKLVGFEADPAGTVIDELAGDFQISDGRASTSNLRLRSPTGTLKAAGSFGFDKTVDFQILAELPSAASKKNANINPLLDLAAASFFRNEQGNIVLPLRMTGTVVTPHFTLDSKLVQENLRKRGLNQVLDSFKSLLKSKPGSAPSGQDAAPAKPSEQKPASLEDLLKGAMDKLEEKQK